MDLPNNLSESDSSDTDVFWDHLLWWKRPSSPQPQPFVTLFFDSEKVHTIAVLSKRIQALDVYFQCLIARKQAAEISPIYFEMKGFVRENESRLRRFSKGNCCIKIAQGSLQSSDDTQKDLISHRRCHRMTSIDPLLLEKALDVARNHRLSDDLDVVSLFFMNQTSSVLRKIASPMIEEKMKEIDLVINPLVDGVIVSGFSTFDRHGFPSRKLVNVKEVGQTVQYSQQDDIRLRYSESSRCYQPVTGSGSIQWCCTELALANLHRWWGDISLSEYLGQKMVLQWHTKGPDELAIKSNFMTLNSLGLGPQVQDGHHSFHEFGTLISVQVVGSRQTSADTVTTTFTGIALVDKVHIDFISLVRAAARRLLAPVHVLHQKVLETRPLLDSEQRYLRSIEMLTKMRKDRAKEVLS